MFPTARKISLPVAFASAAILLGGLSGCAKTETAASLLAEAKQFQLKGDNAAAVIQLKNAVAMSPDDAEARLALGSLHQLMGDSPSAEKELRKALSLGAAPDRVWPVLGTAMVGLRQFQKMLDETAPLAAKAGPELLTARGDAQLALNQADQARDSYALALKAQPDAVLATIGQARLALQGNDVAAANILAEQAVVKAPTSPDAWMFKGDLVRAQNKPAEALAAYDKVLALKPDHRSARVEKVFVEIGMSKFEAARTDLEAAKKSNPGNLMVTYAQALLDFTEGKHAPALESVQKILRVASDHYPTILLAGAVQFNLGSLQQAETHLRKYLEVYPQNVYARKLLVSTLLKSGRTSEALALLAPALQEGKNDAQLLALAGEVHLLASDFAKAADFFQQASALEPKMASFHTALAVSRLGQGDNEQAISELETSTKLDAATPKAGMLLVLTELRLKRYDRALAAATRLEQAKPKEPLVHNLTGGVHLAKGDPAMARASFEKALALQPTYFPAVENLAQMALAEKKPEEARKLFMALLEKDKKSVEAMTALAKLSAFERKPAEVTQWLEKAYAEHPDAVAPAVQLLRHYLASGASAKALTLARKVVVANPDNADLLDLLGQAQIANNDVAAALESYSKAAGLAPKSALAQLRLASVHVRMKNEAAAADDLKKALALQPDFLDAQVAQADLALRMRKPELAQAVIRDIQKQRPKEARGYVMEGEFQQAQGKLAPALKAFEHAFSLDKSGTLLVRQHILLLQMGNGKEADARMALWRKEHPNDPVTGMYLADMSLAKNDFKLASTQLEQVLIALPGNVAALNNLAWAYQQQRDPRALATAEQLLAAAGQSPAALDTVGWILTEQGNTARGLPLLQKAVAAAPNAPEIRFHLGAALAKSGDKAGARRELEKLLAENKAYPKVEEVRALLKQL